MTAREVLDGIKDRLTKATPGPWDRFDAQIRHTQIDGWVDPTGRAAARAQTEHDIQFVMNTPVDVARLTRAIEDVLAVADQMKWEAENAEHGARAAAEINDGAGLRAWESEKYVYQQAERKIRAAIEDALNPKEGQ